MLESHSRMKGVPATPSRIADPSGGWESGDVADGETSEQNAHAKGSPRLNDAEPSDPIEGDAASQGIDPDMSTEE